MGVANTVILDTAKAWKIANAGYTNVLIGGPYHLARTLGVLTGLDDTWKVLVVTNAAKVQALNILYAMGTYACWPIYDATNVKVGYLAITDSTEAYVCLVDSSNVLTLVTIDEDAFLTGVLTYTGGAAVDDDVADAGELTDAIAAAKVYSVYA